MGSNPINLVFRFILELVALAVFAYRGWTMGDGLTSFLWAALLPIAAAGVWGIFRVPGDASSSGRALVQVPGWVRLALELLIFGIAAWMLFSLQRKDLAILFSTAVGLHYLLSWDRILWLLRS